MMHKLLLMIPLCAGMYLLAGCNTETNSQPDTKASIKVTVRSGGQPVGHIGVYLFESENETNTAEAISSVRTQADGVATIPTRDLTGLKAGEVLYASVLEETKPQQYTLLGTDKLTLEQEGTLSLELDISRPNQYGHFPTTITSELALSEYERWKRELVVPCESGLRVVSENREETKVEAIGFGMLLAAYAADKPTFDGLHAFYKSKRTTVANNMMAWDVTCAGINDPGSATDGDIDVAFALIVASRQWDGPYLEEAKEILSILSNAMIATCTVRDESIYVLWPGYSGGAWGGCAMTDLMYHTPAFFRVFAVVMDDPMWDKLAEDTYILLEGSAHPETGLVPDWQTAEGTPGPGGRAGHFGYDACRAPWRLALDFLWNGDTRSKEWCSKVSKWAEGVGPANLVDGYELDGTPRGPNGVNSAFLGGFSVAAMTHSRARANTFGTEMGRLNDSYWFNFSTRCLYLFTMTGNFGKIEVE